MKFLNSIRGVYPKMKLSIKAKGHSFLMLILPILLTVFSFADVNSTSGHIGFDVDSAGMKEMTLNSFGLGIGVEPSANLHVQGNALIGQSLVVGGSNSSTSNLHVMGSVAMVPHMTSSISI
jgi:hypothetical protein